MLKLPYGTSNFSQIAYEKYYFVDRMPYITQLEELSERYLFFLRPRRFGKSVFVSILQCYYGVEMLLSLTNSLGALPLANNQHRGPINTWC